MKRSEKAAETSALPAVTVNFGDGSAPGTGTLGEAIEHRYAAGTYTINATGTAGNGRTRVNGPGLFDIVVTETPVTPPPNQPAAPVLTAPNRSVTVGGDPTEYATRMTNATGSSDGCTVKSTMTATGLTPDEITTEYDAAGTWTELETVQDGTDTIRLVFGSGFTIGPGYDQTSQLRQSIPSGSPLTGTIAGRQEVLAANGTTVLASADFTITVVPEA